MLKKWKEKRYIQKSYVILHVIRLKTLIDNKYSPKLSKEGKNLNKLLTIKQYESTAEIQPMMLTIPDLDRFIENSSKLQKIDNLYLKENIKRVENWEIFPNILMR